MTKSSCDKRHIGHGALQVTLLLLLLAVITAACEHPRHPAPTDLSEVPQHGARARLRSILADLTVVPATPDSFKILEQIRAPIYSRSVDLVQLLSPQSCNDARDTCVKQLRVYSWDTSSHRYVGHDSLVTRTAVRTWTQDVSGDHLDEVLLETHHDAEHSGLTVLGVTAASHVLVSRYQRDTIRPMIVALTSRHRDLIEYDSIYSRLVTDIGVRVPKKFFSLQGEFYLEAPADSNWARFVDRVRDSVHLVLSLTREELQSEKYPDVGLQQSFVRANIAAALLDTSWFQGQRRLNSAIRDFGSKLTVGQVSALERLATTARASHFVRASGSWNPQLLEVLGDLDDAIALGDPTRVGSIVSYIAQNIRDANTLTRAGATLVAHNTAVWQASQLLAIAVDLNPRSVAALRSRARALSILGYPDSSRALLVRSLQFDSTSSEALGIKQSLGY